MKINSILFFVTIVLLSCQEISETTFIVSNNLNNEVKVEVFFQKKLTKSLEFDSKSVQLICYSQKMGKNKYVDFDYLFSCSDSISITNSNGEQSKKNYMLSSEWNYSVKPSYQTEFKLNIDVDDF